MSLEVNVLDSVEAADRNQWNHVVEHAPLGCLYHRYEWIRAVEAGTEPEPKHIVVTKNDNPVGILPNVVRRVGPVRRLDSIAPGFGGPLASTDETEVLELLLTTVDEACPGKTVLSRFRTLDSGYVRYHRLFRQHGYGVTVDACRFTIDLTQPWKETLEKMTRSRRRAVRRGNDGEVAVADEELTDRTLSSFYDRYASVMERSGLPALPRSFVLELQTLESRIKLFTLSVDGELAGSILCHLNDEQSTIHYAYSGITEEDFQYNASELLHEHVIKFGMDRGYTCYDLRRTEPDFRDGVFRFKEQFGGDVVPVLNWERGHPRPAVALLRAYRSVLTDR